MRIGRRTARAIELLLQERQIAQASLRHSLTTFEQANSQAELLEPPIITRSSSVYNTVLT